MKYKGMVGQNPSSLSNKPPCPGIILPLSFTPACLLRNDSYMSPNILKTVITITAENNKMTLRTKFSCLYIHSQTTEIKRILIIN